jgi:molybdopterin-containing oxidoreductase family iron-sulfur binding subunit
MHYGMVIDLKRCIGCYACVAACRAENATGTGVMFSRVQRLEWGKYPAVKRMALPLLCMHCEDPPCMDVCPTGATKQRPDGIVWIDKDLCIGCRYCMLACPYAARYFYDREIPYFGNGEKGNGRTPFEEQGYARHALGTVEKCDFCSARVDQGLEPACVANCPAKARIFGDLDDHASPVSGLIRDKGAAPLNPEAGTNPSVFYLPP